MSNAPPDRRGEIERATAAARTSRRSDRASARRARAGIPVDARELGFGLVRTHRRIDAVHLRHDGGGRRARPAGGDRRRPQLDAEIAVPMMVSSRRCQADESSPGVARRASPGLDCAVRYSAAIAAQVWTGFMTPAGSSGQDGRGIQPVLGDSRCVSGRRWATRRRGAATGHVVAQDHRSPLGTSSQRSTRATTTELQSHS